MERFPDKKHPRANFQEITQHLQDTQGFRRELEVGQEEATWYPPMEYPTLPFMFIFMTDVHYGSQYVDYDTLLEHIEVVEDTPNTGVIFGGDLIDGFSPSVIPDGMLGDIFSPQTQADAFLAEVARLDRMQKVGAINLGNHDLFARSAGYDFGSMFLAEVQAPVFDRGGVLHLMVGEQRYDVGINHCHWGNSKLNPTNSPKRMMEFSYPNTDIALVGHTHYASGEQFSRGGKEKIAIVGGTYKTEDYHGKRWGAGKSGIGGYTVMLWPDERKMELIRDPQVAQQFMLSMIFEKEVNGQQ